MAIYDMVIFISDRIRNDYTSACSMYSVYVCVLCIDSIKAVFYKHYVILFYLFNILVSICATSGLLFQVISRHPAIPVSEKLSRNLSRIEHVDF